MKKILLFLSLYLTIACGVQKQIPVKETTVVNYKDSIVFRDSTIYHHIYKEHFTDFTRPLDTLSLETTYSKFKAWNDTTSNTLRGTAENKKDSIPVRTKWKERIIEKEIIVEKEVPVYIDVEKKYIPNFVWWIIVYACCTIVYFLVKLYFKIKIWK